MQSEDTPRVQVPEWLVGMIGDEPEELSADAVEEARKAWARHEGGRLAHHWLDSQRIAGDIEVRTVAEQLEDDHAEMVWTVQDLHARGDNTMLVAQNKVGKTTLALNLVRSLIDREEFLGQFHTDLPDGRVLYLNYEVSDVRFLEWLRRLDLANPDRLVVLHLRGKVFPLDHSAVHERVARAARAHDARLLVVDPFQRAFTGESEADNAEVGRFLAKLDELKDRAGVPDLIVVDHAGHSESARDRARGASVKGGWPDSTWSLTRNSETRRFTAFGRDIDIANRALRFDAESLRLTLTEAAPTVSRPALSLADHGLLAVIRAVQEMGEARGVAEVRRYFEGLEGSKHSKALKAAQDLGFVQREVEGQAHTFAVTEAGQERYAQIEEPRS